jgi:hypothetical protein
MAQQNKAGPNAYDEAQKSKLNRAGYWLDELSASQKWHKEEWWDRAEEVIRAYRGIYDDASEVFNILWSNVETLKPIVYSHTPKPEVQRRFLEKDRIGSDMAIVMERAIEFSQSIPGKTFDAAITQARDDFLLSGRGVCRVVYDATFTEEKVGEKMSEDLSGVEDVTEEKKAGEEAYIKYVYWKDFLHSNGMSWDNVWWNAFATDMTRNDLRNAFGNEIGDKIPLCGKILMNDDFYHEGDYDYNWAQSHEEGYARVWEIWDKRSRTVVTVAEGYEYIIEESDDPYELEEFFPTPKPLYAIETTGSLTPIPEYTMYQYQAEELNIITRRMSKLVSALKVRGICDADIKSLTRMFEGEDNEVIPDEEFGKLAAAGGIKGAIEWAPIMEFAQALAALLPQRDGCLNNIYEITGLSDILRGASDPRETATAVRKKGMFGSLRIRDRQKKIQTYCKDLMGLQGELISNLFDPETLILMSGVEQRPEIMSGMEEITKRLQDDAMRDYTINVQTDSTVAIDEEARREETQVFFTAVANLLQQIIPAVQEGIIPAPVAQEFLMFLAKRFDAGRELEAAIEQIGQQPPPDQGPSPEEQAKAQMEQAKLQLEQQKLELQAQEQQMRYNTKMIELKLKAAEMQQKGEIEEAKLIYSLIEEKMNQETVRINAQGGRAN